MSTQQDNKMIVDRWLVAFWGERYDEDAASKLASKEMTLVYSLYEPVRGRVALHGFMTDLRQTFSDLRFSRTSDLVAEGDCVSCRWEGSAVHSGPSLGDFVVGALPPPTGTRCRSAEQRC